MGSFLGETSLKVKEIRKVLQMRNMQTTTQLMFLFKFETGNYYLLRWSQNFDIVIAIQISIFDTFRFLLLYLIHILAPMYIFVYTDTLHVSAE